MRLTLYNGGLADANAWIADDSGTGRRVAVRVPAGHNVEVRPTAWGGLSSAALTISADRPIVAMRATALGATAAVDFGQAATDAPCLGARPCGLASPRLSVVVPAQARQGDTAHVIIHATPNALIHIAMTLPNHPAVSLFDVTDPSGLLRLDVQAPRQITGNRSARTMRITVQAMSEQGQTETTRTMVMLP